MFDKLVGARIGCLDGWWAELVAELATELMAELVMRTVGIIRLTVYLAPLISDLLLFEKSYLPSLSGILAPAKCLWPLFTGTDRQFL